MMATEEKDTEENPIEENNNENYFEGDRFEIFGEIYLSNTQNRLRELDTPGDVDCKRWPWE